jgi:hypothetical protein
MKHVISIIALFLITNSAFAANAPKKEEAASQQADDQESADKTDKSTTEKTNKSETKAHADSAVNNRLFLGTSVGWGVIKPSKGSWNGLGTSDVSARWRTGGKEGGNLFITGRYAPFVGVWHLDHRDYDTTLHGIYAGTEYVMPISSMNLKAGVELGYMLVYAKPQDNGAAASDVKGNKVNLSAGGGADWGFFGDKVRIGPFARVHFAGFSIINIGGSVQFGF